MSCCDMNAQGYHCSCETCGLCAAQDAEAAALAATRRKALGFVNLTLSFLFGFGLGSALCVLLHGCTVDLEPRPLGHRTDPGVTVVIPPRVSWVDARMPDEDAGR